MTYVSSFKIRCVKTTCESSSYARAVGVLGVAVLIITPRLVFGPGCSPKCLRNLLRAGLCRPSPSATLACGRPRQWVGHLPRLSRHQPNLTSTYESVHPTRTKIQGEQELISCRTSCQIALQHQRRCLLGSFRSPPTPHILSPFLQLFIYVDTMVRLDEQNNSFSGSRLIDVASLAEPRT